MPLTYQPFAAVPEVNQLSEQLHQGDPGRSSDLAQPLSLLAGGALILAGLARQGLTRWLCFLIGGALIQKAIAPAKTRAAALRGGVPGNYGSRLQSAVEVRCSQEALYTYWRDLSNLPHIMSHVKSVEQLGGKRSHWTLQGPAGQTASWDAEIINERPHQMLAWQTVPGALLKNAGSVWFEETQDGSIRVKVALEFDPAGGVVGSALGWLVKDIGQRHLDEDLANFKNFAERELTGQDTGAAV